METLLPAILLLFMPLKVYMPDRYVTFSVLLLTDLQIPSSEECSCQSSVCGRSPRRGKSFSSCHSVFPSVCPFSVCSLFCLSLPSGLPSYFTCLTCSLGCLSFCMSVYLHVLEEFLFLCLFIWEVFCFFVCLLFVWESCFVLFCF